MAASNAESSSSSAGISVSGTYRPPNAPKRWRVSVGTLVRAKSSGCCEELPHQPRVFDAGRDLDAGGNVDHIGSKRPDCTTDVVWLQTSGENDSGAPPVARQIERDVAPRKRFARAAEALVASRIQHDRVGGVEEHLCVGWDVRICNTDCCPNFAAESSSNRTHVSGTRITVQLDDVETRLPGNPRNLLR